MTKLLRAFGALCLAGLAGHAGAESGAVPNNDPLRPLPAAVRISHIIPAAPNIMGTAALNAGVTLYDARFRRVAAADRSDSRVLEIARQLEGLSPVEQLYRVKQAVAQRVRYGSDLDTIGVSDLWGNAGETLQRGMGDDEDIAIVEMQALKAAGFNPADLYLSIGRHKQRGAHTVLVARTPQGFYVLDDAEAHPVMANGRGKFVPMITIGEGRSWIHGYRRAGYAAR